MTTQIYNIAVRKRSVAMGVTGLIFLVSFLVFVVQGMWGPSSIMLILFPTVFVPAAIEKWTPVKIHLSLQVLYALLLLLGPYLGGALGLYAAWQPWDTLVHLYSGVPVSFAIVSALGVLQQVYRFVLPVWFEVFVLIAVKAFVAFLWEIGEFVVDLIFDTNTQNDNFDTMTDMIAGLTPALFIAAVLVMYRRNGRFKYVGFLLNHAGANPS